MDYRNTTIEARENSGSLPIPSGSGSASAEQHGHPVDFLCDGHASGLGAGPRTAIGLADVGGNPNGEHGPALPSRRSSPRRVRPSASSASEAAVTVPLDSLHSNGFASLSPPVLGSENDPNLGIYGIGSSALDSKGFFSELSEPVEVDPETGEIRREGWNYSAALVERYALQAQARRAMLEAHRREECEGKPHGVTRCRRWLRPRGKFDPVYAEVFKHPETGRTHYGGLEICGSPWACPVCAPKIAELRAEEIRQAVDQWIASGGICFFVTLTIPHQATDALGPMVQGFRKALERFRSGRAFQAIKSVIGYFGMIRALEITWGEANGWHPHSHEIWFCRSDGFPQEALLQRWQDCAEAAGFRRPSWRGLIVRKVETEAEARERLAEYCAKLGQVYDPDRPLWGAAEELTRAHSKRGRGRFTPWDFLRAQYDPEVSPTERARYRALFAEYVIQFKRLAQVFWSPGLKARFELAELSDEEAANELREPADSLAKVEWEDWVKVIGRHDHRASVLVIAQAGGAPALRSFLSALPVPDFFTSPQLEDSS